ncbi:hypothetical protein FGIG_03741 [Fasciola gigantica]|uniref:Uncharacterized protein n=1 Tax=Fasciola gigantica TaxID=46835 RepID=A0A504YQV6_FASGI|nr:hypothetical protein FGIG_03741 [Fasciola gigantica]
MNMIQWTGALKALDHSLIVLLLVSQISAVFSVSVNPVTSSELNMVDFPESDYVIGLDLSDSPNYPLGRTTEELQKNLDVNRARAKDENVWHLLHELDRRSKLLSKWHSLRALRFG